MQFPVLPEILDTEADTPFYKQTWFMALMCCIISLIIAALVYFFVIKKSPKIKAKVIDPFAGLLM